MTVTEMKTVGRVLNGIWQYIGNDIMQACGEEGIDDIPRDHVVELVLDRMDSDMMPTIARLFTRAERPKALALMEKFNAIKYKDRCLLADGMFPHERYG